MSKFEYPRLSRKEIITILTNTGIPSVSDSDLSNPTFDSVGSLYSNLLLYVDFLQEDYGQVDFTALQQLDNPDVHIDSVRVMNLYHKIKELVAAIHSPIDFTLVDLLHPDAARTEFFVGALLNFCLYKNTKMNIMSPIMEELPLRLEEQTEIEKKKNQLNEEISEYNEAREREMHLVQEVDAKVKELHQIISRLNNQQSSLRTNLKKIKEKTVEMDEKISGADFILTRSSQDNSNLRAKIVQSPEKLQRELEERKLVQLEATNAERLAMQSFQEKTAIDEVYKKALKKLSKHIAQMQAIQEQVSSAKSIEKDVKVLKVKLSEDQVLDKSLEAKLVERQGKEEQFAVFIRELKKERDSNCDKASKELNNVKLEVESRRKAFEIRQKKVEAVVSEVDAVTSKIRTVKEYGVSKQQELARKCEEILKELYEYSNSIGFTPPNVAGLEVHQLESSYQF